MIGWSGHLPHKYMYNTERERETELETGQRELEKERRDLQS